MTSATTPAREKARKAVLAKVQLGPATIAALAQEAVVAGLGALEAIDVVGELWLERKLRETVHGTGVLEIVP